MIPPTKKSLRPRLKTRASSSPGRATATAERPGAQRVQKVLARLGVASRREAEDWIRAGRLTINGEVATLGARVRPTDQLRLDGRLIRQREPGAAHVFACHRSPGASLDDLLSRFPRRGGRRFIAVSPMPRIDGGLEIVTSDGELAVVLQRAAHRWSSEFSVRVRGALPNAALQGVLEGTLDRGERLQVESCEPVGEDATNSTMKTSDAGDAGAREGPSNRWYLITARGGSGKDVRQLFERQGAIVSRVLRTRLGPIALERELPRGHSRELREGEISALTAAAAALRSSAR